MAITFKYGAPGPILQAGFAAGVGRRQQRQQEDALRIWERENQQQFQAEQAAIGRQFQFGLQQQQFGQALELQGRAFNERALQEKLGREFQAEQTALGREFQAEQTEGLISARAAEAGREREHDLALAGRREAYLRDTATIEGLRTGELELPPEAQNRLRQLESGRVEAMKLEPTQQQEFMEQYEKEKSALLGLAQPAKALPIGEQFEQSTFEKDGTLYQRGKDGSFDVLREAPKDPAQDFNDRVIKRYETLRKQLNEDTGEPISDEEAQRQAIADEMRSTQFRQRLSGGATTPAGLPSPAAGQQAEAGVGAEPQGTRPASQTAAPRQAPQVAQSQYTDDTTTLPGPPNNKAWSPVLARKTNDTLRKLYEAHTGDPGALTLIGKEMALRRISPVERPQPAPKQIDRGTLKMSMQLGVLRQMTEEEVEALPDGAWFLDPTGMPRQK